MSYYDILIIGAGPVGLTAAIEAQRKGFNVKIIDKAAQDNSKSNAIGVNPRSLEVLEASGVADKLIQEGFNLKESYMLDRNFTLIVKIQTKYMPSKYKTLVCLKQHLTENIMSSHLQENFDVQVQRLTHLVDFEELTKPIEANSEIYNIKSTIQDETGKQEVVYSKYLIGADGVHSTVRKTLGFPFEGYQVKEKMCAFDCQLDVPDSLKEKQFAILSPKEGYSIIAFAYLGKGEHRVIGFAESIEELKSVVPKRITIKENSINWTTVFQSQVRQVESYQKGHIFLAGDSAHCHTPVGGKGMNLGIEDACILIGLIKQQKTDIYTKLRHPAGKSVIKESTDKFKFISKKGIVGMILRFTIFMLFYWIPSLQAAFMKQSFGLNTPKYEDILK